MPNQLNLKYYRDVPQDLAENYLRFRKTFPYQEKEITGRTWRFLDTFQGEEVLLVLAGATTAADISFMTLEFFAQTYRVIARIIHQPAIWKIFSRVFWFCWMS